MVTCLETPQHGSRPVGVAQTSFALASVRAEAAADHPSRLLDTVVAQSGTLDASKDEPVETDTKAKDPSREAATTPPHYYYYWVLLVTWTRWIGAAREGPKWAL